MTVVDIKTFAKSRSAAQYLIFAVFCFMLSKTLIKTIPHIPSYEIVLFRSLVAFFICIYFIRRRKVSMLGTHRKLLFFRGFFGSLGMLTFFYAIQHLPLITVTGLMNLKPIFVIIFAAIFLKEKNKFYDWFFFPIAFAGALLLKGFDAEFVYFDFYTGVLGAIFSAIAMIFIRKIGKREDPFVIIFYASFISFFIFVPLTILNWVTPTIWEWCMLILIGLVIQSAQICLTLAYQTSKTAASIAHYSYIDAIGSAIIGLIIFKESISIYTVLGILMIIGSVYTLRTLHKRGDQAKAKVV